MEEYYPPHFRTYPSSTIATPAFNVCSECYATILPEDWYSHADWHSQIEKRLAELTETAVTSALSSLAKSLLKIEEDLA